MKIPKISGETMAILAAAGVAALVLFKVADKAGKVITDTVDLAGGLLTGNNALTTGASNGAGEKTSAYQGWGVVGTLGAATNAVSGGTLASLGEWIGGKVFDVTH